MPVAILVAGIPISGIKSKVARRVNRKQGGYMLVAAMFSILLLSATTLMLLRLQARNAAITRDEGDGAQMAQLAVGLRGAISAAQSDPSLLPAGKQMGVDWLKSPSCGGLATNPVEGFVPCTFSGGSLGKLFETTFTHDVTVNAIESRTTLVVPPRGDQKSGILRAERMTQAAIAGQGATAGIFFTAIANSPVAANAPVRPDMMAAADAGRVVLVAGNAPSNDIYLRTDGTNRMLANLQMGGMSIENARDGQFTGDVRVRGRTQLDAGLTVQGSADLRGGLVTNEIALTSIGKYVSEGFYDAAVITGLDIYYIAKPDCSQAGNNPGIYVAMQGTGTMNQGGYVADALYQARADVYDSGTYWTIRPVAEGTRFGMTKSGTNLSFTKQLLRIYPKDMSLLVMRRCR